MKKILPFSELCILGPNLVRNKIASYLKMKKILPFSELRISGPNLARNVSQKFEPNPDHKSGPDLQLLTPHTVYV